MTFSQKRIDVTFTLAPVVDASGKVQSQPTFAGGASNSVTLSGYRASASIVKGGGLASQGRLQLRIYGMSLSLMNQLSTLGHGPIYAVGPQMNTVSVFAGDDKGMSLVFKGSISQAYTDLGGAPDAMFTVDAYSLLYQAAQIISPTSYSAPVDVATVLQGLANQMGLGFENNGVSVITPTVYLDGSALSQVQDCLRMANIEWNQGDNGVLAIWPRGGSRAGPTAIVSSETGLVGYPYPSNGGFLGLRTVFNPQINFGAKIQVQSSITPANGPWQVQSMIHDIESETPGGAWFTSLTGVPLGYIGTL